MKKPRKVEDWEISPYQGLGGREHMQKAQSRKRRQVRNKERSIWDNVAPQEYHGVLWVVYIAVFIIGLITVSAINGYL